MSEQSLSIPPFPPLRWDVYSWVGEVALPSWAGFQSRRGPYASVDDPNPSGGLFRLSVATEDDRPGPPSPEQVEAIRFLLDHEADVGASLLQEIFSAYPEIREQYGGFLDDEELDEIMPEIHRPDDLRGLIGLSQIHLLRVASRGQAYLGFELGCNWDEEHGLGVMTHRGRVIEIGQADTSFNAGIAERDARSRA